MFWVGHLWVTCGYDRGGSLLPTPGCYWLRLEAQRSDTHPGEREREPELDWTSPQEEPLLHTTASRRSGLMVAHGGNRCIGANRLHTLQAMFPTGYVGRPNFVL